MRGVVLQWQCLTSSVMWCCALVTVSLVTVLFVHIPVPVTCHSTLEQRNTNICLNSIPEKIGSPNNGIFYFEGCGFSRVVWQWVGVALLSLL